MNDIVQRFAALGAEFIPEWRRRRAAPANKLSTVLPKGTAYRYWRGKVNGKGQVVRFCWSCHRNEAGYFLGWRQVHMKNGTVKRDQWVARRSRKRAKALAARRAAR